MIKYLSITILFLIFFSQPLLAEIWDFGLGIVFVPGRMENYDPAQIEIGASSVKGYGLSVSKQATKSFENLTKEEKSGANTYNSKFELSSDALHLFYRFENYVYRWDLGLMHNRNIYTVKIKKNDSSKEIEKTTINVSYTGPYVQYSNTIQGYETGDWFYGIRLFYIYSNSLDSNSYNTIESNDTFIIEYNNIMNNFIKENNPNNAFGINITFGWRL